MQNPDFFEAIEALAKSKAYHQLNISDKKLVDSQMSVEEYDQLHDFFRKSFKTDQLIEPDLAIYQQLKNQFVKKSIPGMTGILSYKIPAYIAVAAAAMLAFFFNVGISNKNPVSDPIHDTITIVKYIHEHPDTIFKQETAKLAISEKSIHRDSKSTKSIKQENHKSKSSVNNYNEYTKEVLQKNLAQANSKPRGRSMNKDSIILSFLVQTY